tara:strand:+ start:2124 stop:2444 length:321 start_codon:yes stop_codon:yes gene_type:complete
MEVLSPLPARPTVDLAKRAVALALETMTDVSADLQAIRAKHVAFAALSTLYPALSGTRIGLYLSYDKPSAAAAYVDSAKRRHWWNDTHVDHVIGALVGADYGERAQ